MHLFLESFAAFFLGKVSLFLDVIDELVVRHTSLRVLVHLIRKICELFLDECIDSLQVIMSFSTPLNLL